MVMSVLSRFRRPPDFVIGQPSAPYMRRWWLIPRNRFFNVYLHEIRRDDDDRALHDHPWWNVSIVLRGAYREITPKGEFMRRAGSIVFRRPSALHRLELPVGEYGPGIRYCWSLFITGPRVREWGFACPQGWVPWFDFVAKDNPGDIGRGCGEYPDKRAELSEAVRVGDVETVKRLTRELAGRN